MYNLQCIMSIVLCKVYILCMHAYSFMLKVRGDIYGIYNICDPLILRRTKLCLQFFLYDINIPNIMLKMI